MGKFIGFVVLISCLSMYAGALEVIDEGTELIEFSSFVFRSDLYDRGLAHDLVLLPLSDDSFRDYNKRKLPAVQGEGLRLYTFKNEFRIDPILADSSFDLLIAPVESPYILFINGYEIGTIGRFADQYNSFSFQAVSFPIPKEFLGFGDETNILTVQVITQFEQNSLSQTLCQVIASLS